jgi:hypothetical protein
MKNTTVLLILGAVLIILTFTAKPIKKAMTRGYQNKNPGNIRLTFLDSERKKPEYWKGEVKGTDKAFKTFKSMPWGYRAIFVLLRTYINTGKDTIEKIISTYAPSSENNTLSYISSVVYTSGIPKTQKLSFDKPDELKKIVAGISLVENGISASTDEISKGYELFKTA